MERACVCAGLPACLPVGLPACVRASLRVCLLPVGSRVVFLRVVLLLAGQHVVRHTWKTPTTQVRWRLLLSTRAICPPLAFGSSFP